MQANHIFEMMTAKLSHRTDFYNITT